MIKHIINLRVHKRLKDKKFKAGNNFLLLLHDFARGRT